MAERIAFAKHKTPANRMGDEYFQNLPDSFSWLYTWWDNGMVLRILQAVTDDGLGHYSFGEYLVKESIEWNAEEFEELTREKGYKNGTG